MKDDVFAVIADSTRRQILQALAVERLAVGELVEQLGVSQPTVSKHLKVLRTAGLVETEAVGQKRFYSITPTPLRAVKDWTQALLETPARRAGKQDTSSAIRSKPHKTAHQQDKQTRPSSPETKVSQVATGSYSTDIEEESPMAIEVPQEQLDLPLIPHPTNAGISITPLVPFTPDLDPHLAEASSEIIDADQVFLGQQAESTQALSAESESVAFTDNVGAETLLQLEVMAKKLTIDLPDGSVPTAENLVAGEGMPAEEQDNLIKGADAEAEAAVAESQERASVTEAQAKEAAEEGGLFSKLARWGRRSNR